MNTEKETIDDKIKNSAGLSGKTINGLLWMFSGAGAESILKFVVLIVLARLLAVEDFGVVGAAQVVVSFATILSMLGIGQALIQRKIVTENHINTAFIFSIILNFIIAVMVYLLAPTLSEIFRMEELIPVIKVLSLIFVIQGFSIVAESLLQRELQFKVLAKIQFLSFIAYTIVGIMFAIINFGLWSLVIANIVQVIIKSVYTLKLKPHSKKLFINIQSLKELFYFGGGFSIAKISNQIALQGDNAIVGRYLGAEDLGIYSRAYQLMVMPVTLFGRVLDKVLFPAMSKVQDDTERLLKIYISGITMVALILLPISMGFLLMANEIITIVFGIKWSDMVIPFQILVLGLLFRTSYKISESLARAKGAVYRGAYIQTIYALLVIIGAWVGQIWGITGVSVGVLVAILANFVFMTRLALKILGVNWNLFIVSHIPSLVISIILGLQMYLIKQLLNSLGTPSYIIIIVEVIISIILLGIMLYFVPQIVIGKKMVKFVVPMLKYLPRHIRKLYTIRYQEILARI